MPWPSSRYKTAVAGGSWTPADMNGAQDQFLRTAGIERGDLHVAVGIVPTGSVLPFAGPSAPSGWLLCDGSAVARAQYVELFALIGTTYGAGDGSTTFNVPDLRGRVAVGVGLHADVNARARQDLLAAADRRPYHGHNVNNHSHSFSGTTGGQSGAVDKAQYSTTPTVLNIVRESHTHGFSGNTGNSAPGTDAQGPSYLTFHYIIRA